MNHYKWPLIGSAAVLGLVGAFAGLSAVWIVAVLAVLEVSLSFDNAVVNAKVLEKMSEVWQKRFLTWGILVAVFGMRMLFPLIVVSVIAGISPWGALDLALLHPAEYSSTLSESHVSVAAFGGFFLAMVFFEWLFNASRDVHWLPVERVFAQAGNVESATSIAALSVLLGMVFAVPEHERAALFIAGVAGIITHMIISGVSGLFMDDDSSDNVAAGGAALFVYIEVLDASFSFDGVIGALAVTSSFLLISAGTGIGALFVRSATVQMLRGGVLQEYRFLEHGAHWAIGALVALMLSSVLVHIPEVVTGLVSFLIIVAAVISSKLVKDDDVATDPIPEGAV